MIVSKVGKQPKTLANSRWLQRQHHDPCGITPVQLWRGSKRFSFLYNTLNGKESERIRLFSLVINMAKEFARGFYSSKQWQECRNEYARRKHYLCEDCLRRGIYKPGVIVHHIEELTPFNITNPEIALGFDNLELLCRECHLREHGLEGGRWAMVNAAKKKSKRDARRFSVDEYGRVTAK